MGYFLVAIFFICVSFFIGFSELLVTIVPEPLLLAAVGLGAFFLTRAIVKAWKN